MFWRAVQERRLGAPFIRVFDPTLRKTASPRRQAFLRRSTTNKPFLVDSVLAEIADRGLAVKAIFHPIMRVKRDASGGFRGFRLRRGRQRRRAGKHDLHRLLACESSDQLADIHAGVARVLADVDAAVVDWKLMQTRLDQSIARALAKPAAGAREGDRGIPRLPEMAQGKSLYVLGRARLRLRESQRQRPVAPAHRHRARHLACSRAAHRAAGPGPRRADAGGARLLDAAVAAHHHQIDRTLDRSPAGAGRLHRHQALQQRGALVGERRFVGLFTSAAYNESPRRDTVPGGARSQRHGARGACEIGPQRQGVAQVLETFPRDELFQISDEDLLRIAPGIAYLTDRPRTKVFLRFDTFNRFASALV